MSSDTKPLIDLFTKMITRRAEEIERLLELRDIGINVGTPTVDDFIAQEQLAIDNLQRSVDFMLKHN